jgi:hypothetical protein
MFQDLDSTIAMILNDPASPTKVAVMGKIEDKGEHQ